MFDHTYLIELVNQSMCHTGSYKVAADAAIGTDMK